MSIGTPSRSAGSTALRCRRRADHDQNRRGREMGDQQRARCRGSEPVRRRTAGRRTAPTIDVPSAAPPTSPARQMDWPAADRGRGPDRAPRRRRRRRPCRARPRRGFGDLEGEDPGLGQLGPAFGIEDCTVSVGPLTSAARGPARGGTGRRTGRGSPRPGPASSSESSKSTGLSPSGGRGCARRRCCAGSVRSRPRWCGRSR